MSCIIVIVITAFDMLDFLILTLILSCKGINSSFRLRR